MDGLASFRKGGVIPAHPLALTAERKLDERRQRALTRYYVAAGASGVALQRGFRSFHEEAPPVLRSFPSAFSGFGACDEFECPIRIERKEKLSDGAKGGEALIS